MWEKVAEQGVQNTNAEQACRDLLFDPALCSWRHTMNEDEASVEMVHPSQQIQSGVSSMRQVCDTFNMMPNVPTECNNRSRVSLYRSIGLRGGSVAFGGHCLRINVGRHSPTRLKVHPAGRHLERARHDDVALCKIGEGPNFPSSHFAYSCDGVV